MHICCLVFIPDWVCHHDLCMRNKKKNSNSNKLANVAKPKIRERKLRSGVKIKGALKQKGVKQTGAKQVLVCFETQQRLYSFAPKLTFSHLLLVVLRKYQDRCCLITGSYGCSTTPVDLRPSCATGKLLRCPSLNTLNRLLLCVRQSLQHNCSAGQSANRFYASSQ
jgi:hypothetical protein